MRTIGSIRDLSDYGIISLTGEACSVGLRVLFDLTAQGVRIMCNALSLSPEGFSENWNPGDDSNPHTASVMLTPEMAMELAPFCLFDAGCHKVLKLKDGAFVGMEANEDYQDRGDFINVNGSLQWVADERYTCDGVEQPWPHYTMTVRRVLARPGYRPGINSNDGSFRNTHQFSGRMS